VQSILCGALFPVVVFEVWCDRRIAELGWCQKASDPGGWLESGVNLSTGPLKGGLVI
jgi:hypothetical protein